MNFRRRSQKIVDGIHEIPSKKNKIVNLTGKKICITGVIDGFTRQNYEYQLLRCGTITVPRITKSVDYLIIGKNPGQIKLKLASRYNIKIIDSKNVELSKKS